MLIFWKHAQKKKKMKIAELIRLESSAQGMLGVLKINKAVFCFTLEPPDKENKPYVSCVPAGQYICSLVQSPRHGETYEVKEVHERSQILFHPGNTVDNTEGCILPGSTVGKINTSPHQRAVLNSGQTFRKLMQIMNGQDFHLTILEFF